MKRRMALAMMAGGGLAAAGWRLSAEVGPEAEWRPAGTMETALIASAEAQVGVTLIYDPAYVKLDFPGGDVPRDRGVCTDVVIRALRDAFGADLQLQVNRDMKAAFAAYPKRWGLSSTDRNIDHRRVPNLETYLTRLGAAVPVSAAAGDYLPGDIVTSVFPDGQTHIVLVTNRPSADGGRPLIVHNVGRGARIEDRLFEWKMTGHFRLTPALVTAMGGKPATVPAAG